MFTGIVEALAEVVAVEPTAAGRRLVIKHAFAPAPQPGDSISVNGVCLTVVDDAAAGAAFDVVTETMHRSNLGGLDAGHRVNLERPMKVGGRLDGHIVQGHVDGRGVVAARSAEGESERVRLELPVELSRYVVEKGSITVDGVSLTVTAAGADWLEFVLIPHTLATTTLGDRPLGAAVNLEVDVIAKYVERLMEAHS